jgi:hypothetical protein
MLHRGIMAHDTSMRYAASKALNLLASFSLPSGNRTVADRPAGASCCHLQQRQIEELTSFRNKVVRSEIRRIADSAPQPRITRKPNRDKHRKNTSACSSALRCFKAQLQAPWLR